MVVNAGWYLLATWTYTPRQMRYYTPGLPFALLGDEGHRGGVISVEIIPQGQAQRSPWFSVHPVILPRFSKPLPCLASSRIGR